MAGLAFVCRLFCRGNTCLDALDRCHCQPCPDKGSSLAVVGYRNYWRDPIDTLDTGRDPIHTGRNPPCCAFKAIQK